MSEYLRHLSVSTNLAFGGPTDPELKYYSTVICFYVIVSIISMLMNYFIAGELCAVLETVGYTTISYANIIGSLKVSPIRISHINYRYYTA